jgi:hypothetical protein
VISKTMLTKVMPLGRTPGLYSFRRFRRRIRYNKIAHNKCAESIQEARFKINYLRNRGLTLLCLIRTYVNRQLGAKVCRKCSRSFA